MLGLFGQFSLISINNRSESKTLLLFFLCLFKVYNFVTEKVVREIGKEETVRITSVALCRWVLRSF